MDTQIGNRIRALSSGTSRHLIMLSISKSEDLPMIEEDQLVSPHDKGYRRSFFWRHSVLEPPDDHHRLSQKELRKDAS